MPEPRRKRPRDQDRVFVNLNCKRIQVDEIWAFVYAKQKNVPTAKAAPANAGDVWTWTAIDADTKLIPSWFVGGRDSDAANEGGYRCTSERQTMLSDLW
jgi:hypothetical protein